MSDIHLRKIDLNLLVVFQVLMDELSVARAAEKLGRTPSAVSHALARLRETLDDPLLVKVGAGMRPSPRAIALLTEIEPLLNGLSRALAPPEPFAPATCTRTFRVAGPPIDSLIGEVASRVAAQAPAVRLDWGPYAPNTFAQVVDEQIDVAFGNANVALSEGVRGIELPPIPRLVFARRGHPASNDWSMDEWLRWPHIVVGIPAATRGTVMERLAEQGLSRQIGLRPPNWSAVLPALLKSNMLANMAPIVFSDSPDWERLQVFEPPCALPVLTFRVFWSARLESDPARSWIRRIVIDSFRTLLARAEARIADADIIRPQR